MITQTTPHEIPFYDVDAYRIAWHGNYPKYCEIARCDLLKTIGIPYTKMEQQGYFFPIVEMNIKYLKPLIFGQKIKIVTQLVEWENRLKFEYRILDANSNEVCTKAWTKQVAVAMPENVTQFISPKFIIDCVEAWLLKHPKSEL